ncbi:MAG: proline--tRNA ligase [Firmicutes bacterium]|nr:proline--tRNA ligase [Bacillota bacterium]
MANEKDAVNQIADVDKDFAQWYTDVVTKTQLVDYGPTKGSMVIRPYGYAIWENIQKELDRRFKETGHVNAYFPMLIPLSFLQKEKDHIEGFAPEVAIVTHAGGEELAEKLFIRPTSETIICHMYQKWVQSYRDLPILINQWANVVRWEKTTRPFLRTSEFLWQEGHTLHADADEAMEETLKILYLYEEFCKNILAMPVFIGKKSEKEKFAGAVATYGVEAMMRDGKSLQSGTTHYFGTNFTKVFDITFQDRDKERKHPHESSWGVSTRLIGALIMAHGDERGLCLPPRVAPYQAVIIPIMGHKGGVNERCVELKRELEKAGIRIKLDDSDERPGWKFNEYEMKGVPLRIEIGPRDLENGVFTYGRRDRAGEKFSGKLDKASDEVIKILDDIHENMYAKAKKFNDNRVKLVKNVQELKEAVDSGNFVLTMWCGDRKCEEKVKELTTASTRVMPFDQKMDKGLAAKCVCCAKKADIKIYFAKAY